MLVSHHVSLQFLQVKLAEVIGSFTTPRRMALFWSDKKDLLIETTTQIRTLLCGGERQSHLIYEIKMNKAIAM